MSSIKADFIQATSIVFHSRLYSIALWLIAALVVCVALAAQFSARQPSTVALDVGLSVIRLALPLLTVFMVQELFNREFERKLYLCSFTYPRARTYWLVGRVVAILLINIALVLVMGVLLALLTRYAVTGYEQATPISLGLPYMTTLLFIVLDLMVVIGIATLLAVSATTPSLVLIGTIGFVLIARSYTPIIELLRSNPDVISAVADPHLYQDSLGLLSFLLPDLGRIDVRMIALYDQMRFLPPDWIYLLVATLAYTITLLGISIWVLNKREFN